MDGNRRRQVRGVEEGRINRDSFPERDFISDDAGTYSHNERNDNSAQNVVADLNAPLEASLLVTPTENIGGIQLHGESRKPQNYGRNGGWKCNRA